MAGVLTVDTAAAAAMTKPPPRLPPLREDLTLLRGPATPDGSPTWTLQDAAANRFFRIGWLEMEMLQRWELGTPAAIAAAISAQTTLRPAAKDVERFIQFLQMGNLLQQRGPDHTAVLLKQVAARRMSPAMWLLKNYLFIRIPLVRPDGALAWLAPRLGWLFSGWFLAAVVGTALLGLYLVTRQWDQFLNAFPDLFTPEGAAMVAAALLLSKLLHEMGHGLTAKRYGCRVPSMGVAFMVLWPVLYTDTTDAWKLRSRRQRLAIGSAGMAAELSLAALASVAWSLLPDGPMRSAAFIMATSTWVLTLAVNLNPFMRFDGYMLLSDWWGVPNLQDRSFALARWRIREALFGFGDAPPEVMPDHKRRKLIAYAIGTWIYRFFLFLGIALLVYHMFFKVLGLFLFVVEIWWFILRPVAAELGNWMKRRKELRFNRRTAMTLAVSLTLIAALLIPWRTHVTAPGLIHPTVEAAIYARQAGRVDEVMVESGDRVTAGQLIIRLSSPDMDWQVVDAARSVEVLTARLSGQSVQLDTAQRNQVLWSELQQEAANLDRLKAEAAELVIHSPIDGSVVDLPDGLKPGAWISRGEVLATIVDLGQLAVDAYVPESDLGRLVVGAGASFIPDDLRRSPVSLRLAAISGTATRELPLPELASVHGGEIAVRLMPDGALAPEVAVYRVRLIPEDGVVLPHMALRGRVVIEAERRSPIAHFLRNAIGVVIRESGF